MRGVDREDRTVCRIERNVDPLLDILGAMLTVERPDGEAMCGHLALAVVDLKFYDDETLLVLLLPQGLSLGSIEIGSD